MGLQLISFFRSNKTPAAGIQRHYKPNIHTQTLLLILPEIRLSDNAMREFWLNVYKEKLNLESSNASNKEKEEIHSNDLKIPMKKLFIEMLEAGIEWYDDEQDTIDNQ